MFCVPTAIWAHWSLIVVSNFSAVCALKSAVVASSQAERKPAANWDRTHEDAAPKYLGAADLVDLLEDCSLLAGEASGKDAAEDIEIGQAGNVSDILVLDEWKHTFSWELKRLALPPDGSAISLEMTFEGVLFSIVLKI